MLVRPFSGLFFCVVTLILSAGFASAQSTTGTIYGDVLDPSGAAVAKAMITLTDELAGTRQAASVNSAGNFMFTFLLPGRDTIAVAADGFRPLTDLWQGEE